jgi:hypothetical protein
MLTLGNASYTTNCIDEYVKKLSEVEEIVESEEALTDVESVGGDEL